jgi:nicotinamide-nucleotide amidase
MINAHIITVGDEILIGQTLNTNAAFIGSSLLDISIQVRKTSVIGDNEIEILDEFKDAFNKNDIVIVTGGLGPTHDDLTLKCISEFFQTDLIINNEVLEDIKGIFKRRGRELTEINMKQALVPRIGKVIPNKIGTAPGVFIEQEDKYFFAVPGVPFEMKEMVQNFIIPILKKRSEKEGVVTRILNLQTTGIPESFLFEKLGNLEELLMNGKMAFLPSQYGVKLRITVTDKDDETAKNRLTEIEQKIRNKVGRYIFANSEEPLENVVGRLLKERDIKIAIAESCTGGNICNVLTNISGSSNYFERGIISYSNGSKVELLKVDEDIIQTYGAVSEQTARQMALGIKSISGTDVGLAITGILGPTGATPDKPIGLVYISLCDNALVYTKKFLFGDDRLLNKQRATQAALEMLRRLLLKIPIDD